MIGDLYATLMQTLVVNTSIQDRARHTVDATTVLAEADIAPIQYA